MDDVLIRPETAADALAVETLLIEVFRATYGTGPEEASIVAQMRGRTDWGPCVSLVAERDGAVIGHVFFSPVRLAEAPEIPVCVLGPVGVVQDHQRHGVGGRLIRAGLQQCRALGYRAVVLTGDANYYTRFGFVPIAQTSLKTIFDTPHDMALELEPGMLAQVAGLVEYPEPWLAFLRDA